MSCSLTPYVVDSITEIKFTLQKFACFFGQLKVLKSTLKGKSVKCMI